MNKKELFFFFFIAAFSCFLFFAYADTIPSNPDIIPGLAEPSANGIYKLGNTTIKFFPPEGWKMLKQDFSSREYVGIQFMSPNWTFTTLRISTLPFPDVQVMGATALLENMLKEEAAKDTGVSEQGMIKFADTDAATWVRKLGGTKTKQIQFFVGTNMFMITFGAEEQDFNKLMPIIEKSLTSFKIISQNQ
jgi:hypothetical protein